MALKPCPFCGGEAEQYDFDDVGEDDPNFGGSVIQCAKCGAAGPVHFDRKEHLESSWNDRRAHRPEDPHMPAEFLTKSLVVNLVSASAQPTAQSCGRPTPMCDKWLPMETAPKDGQIIWAYLYHSGIRAVRWVTGAEHAEAIGGVADDYIDGWFEIDQPDEEWAPRWWLPYSSLPLPPEAAR